MVPARNRQTSKFIGSRHRILWPLQANWIPLRPTAGRGALSDVVITDNVHGEWASHANTPFNMIAVQEHLTPYSLLPALEQFWSVSARRIYCHRRSIHCQGGVCQSEDRMSIVAALKDHFGSAHLLVNNAGFTSPDRGKST